MLSTQESTLVGQTLSHYRIIKQYVQGGMDEVYLAEDTDLQRQVVLKVLPTTIRRDANRVRRIRADVEAAIKLNHPNIARIYALERAEASSGVSLQFISMEYVEGQLLSSIIPDDGLPLKKILSWFIPLADALNEAHKRRISHRDIKPDNIIITPDETPKIMDFGLARITRQDLDVLDSQSHTRSVDVLRSLMQSGAVLDAIAYMSPEQAEGRTTNDRTDIFSFGAVLYETVTGNRPFSGESYVDLVSSILRDDSESVTVLKPDVPYLMSQTITTCLQKDLRRRYQSMEKVREGLEEVRREVEPRKVMEEQLATKTRPVPLEDEIQPAEKKWPWPNTARRLVPFAVTFVIGVILSWVILAQWMAVPESRVRKLPVTITASMSAGNFDRRTPSVPTISSDGTKIVYSAEDRLWIRDLANVTPVVLPDTDGGQYAFWAPDNNAIGYFIQNDTTGGWTLRTAGIQGKTGLVVCEVPDGAIPRGAVWRRTGDIVFSLAGGKRQGGVLYTVPERGGRPQTYLAPDTTRGEIGLLYPAMMPDGQALLYTVTTANSIGRLVIHSGNTRTTLVSHPDETLAFPTYSPPGYIIYQRGIAANHALWALPFDGASKSGDPFLVAEHGEFPSVSVDGTLLYHTEMPDNNDQLVWIDRQGHITGVIGQLQERIDNPAISPDGRRVAVTGTERGNTDIWIHEGYMGQKTRLTVDLAYDYFPVWSPSGNQIAFSSVRNVSADIFLAPVDGIGTIRPFVAGRKSEWIADWSQDGRYLTYEVDDPQTKRDLWYIPMNTRRTPTAFLQTPYQEFYPVLSPDGEFIAYQSNESGRPEIYVRRFPSGDEKVTASINGGTAPRWSGSGYELFYVEGNTLMAVAMDLTKAIDLEIPEPLFNAKQVGVRLLGEYQEPAYDVTVDGQRFVVVQRHRTSSMMVVERWHLEFQQNR